MRGGIGQTNPLKKEATMVQNDVDLFVRTLHLFVSEVRYLPNKYNAKPDKIIRVVKNDVEVAVVYVRGQVLKALIAACAAAGGYCSDQKRALGSCKPSVLAK